MDRDDARSLRDAPAAFRSRLPLALSLFGVASLAFDLGCVLIKAPFLRPGLTVGDGLEALGVLVVAALFAWTVRLAGGRAGSGWPPTLAVLGMAAFALGHGIHVASNSIHDLAERNGAGDPLGLMGFWDEGLGHYAVEIGRALFAAVLIGGTSQGTGDVLYVGRGGVDRSSTIAGGVAYGFTTFASAVEGQTVPLVLPLYLAIVEWGLLRSRPPVSSLGRAAVRRFYLSAAGTALIFFAVWGIWQRGFPEFTRAGIIRSAGGAHP